MITIANRLLPFTRKLGAFALIPQSSLVAQVFPALIRLYDISKQEMRLVSEIDLETKGPARNFMLVQNLERLCLTVHLGKKPLHIFPDGKVSYKSMPGREEKLFSRLSLGSHKMQLVEKMRLERDFALILPLVHRLGMLVEKSGEKAEGGIFDLVEECRNLIGEKRPENFAKTFEKLFLAGFKDLFVPRIFDDEYQGIVTSECIRGEPLTLLKETAEFIQSLFISVNEKQISLLPYLPPQFFAGRFIDISLERGILSFEWSKKELFRVVFEAKVDGEISFAFPPSLRRFRLRQSKKGKRVICSVKDKLEINSGSVYLLDCFEE